MKRSTALRRLSTDHHAGLVMVLRTRRAMDGLAAWREMQKRFADEIEPHFALEEAGILPALEAAGETALVEQTLAEHRGMRELIATGGPGELLAFANLLEAHIRFEEAVLFETVQRVLSSEALASIQALHEQTAAPSCPTRSDDP